MVVATHELSPSIHYRLEHIRSSHTTGLWLGHKHRRIKLSRMPFLGKNCKWLIGYSFQMEDVFSVLYKINFSHLSS